MFFAADAHCMLGAWLLLQVIVNLHSVHMDPDDWENPEQFRPERFLDESGYVIGRDRVIAFSLGKSASTHVVRSIIVHSEPHYHHFSIYQSFLGATLVG